MIEEAEVRRIAERLREGGHLVARMAGDARVGPVSRHLLDQVSLLDSGNRGVEVDVVHVHVARRGAAPRDLHPAHDEELVGLGVALDQLGHRLETHPRRAVPLAHIRPRKFLPVHVEVPAADERRPTTLGGLHLAPEVARLADPVVVGDGAEVVARVAVLPDRLVGERTPVRPVRVAVQVALEPPPLAPR